MTTTEGGAREGVAFSPILLIGASARLQFDFDITSTSTEQEEETMLWVSYEYGNAMRGYKRSNSQTMRGSSQMLLSQNDPLSEHLFYDRVHIPRFFSV